MIDTKGVARFIMLNHVAVLHSHDVGIIPDFYCYFTNLVFCRLTQREIIAKFATCLDEVKNTLIFLPWFENGSILDERCEMNVICAYWHTHKLYNCRECPRPLRAQKREDVKYTVDIVQAINGMLVCLDYKTLFTDIRYTDEILFNIASLFATLHGFRQA
jgi:hypothetical protein